MRDILIPDFGSDEAEVIEILVNIGDSIKQDQELLILETDKASMEVPAPEQGVIGAIHIKVGDKVNEGLAYISLVEDDTEIDVESDSAVIELQTAEEKTTKESKSEAIAQINETQEIALTIPDLGTDNAQVIELNVAVGDKVEEGDTLAVIETDKASVEMPSETSGEITSLAIAVGDTIQTGGALATLKIQSAAQSQKPATPTVNVASREESSNTVADKSTESKQQVSDAQPHVSTTNVSHADVHAGPSVRQLARKLGVDLSQVAGTGPRQRVLQEDLQTWVKKRIQNPEVKEQGNSSGIPPAPEVDYSKFGEVTLQSMSKIHKVTAANMLRSWLNVPHVTQFDNADITDLENYRAGLKPIMQDKGIKVTPVAFLVKAAAIALQKNPKFNIALHSNGEQLVQRHYVNIGMAVATSAGLVVPVIRDVNQKSIWTIAKEIVDLSVKARDGKLQLKEMQGGCFTISSLGAIGGTGFTPIVNSPEVGILGVSKSQIMPRWDGKQFIPRTMLPLSLSYDHKVINGADAGKFFTEYVEILTDTNYFPR